MTAPAGIAGQLGYVTETAWNVATTPSKFLPFLNEGLKQEVGRLESKGIRAGRRTVAVWRPGARKVGGQVRVELPNLNLAPLLRHMFGAVTTTGAGPYTHTATPGDLTGKSMTLQVGRPDLTGTVQPFTYTGCKVRSWELGAQAGQLAQLTLDHTAAAEWPVRTVADGTTTNASAAVTSATAAFGASDVGKPISGAGIPAGATIASVQSANAATLSANATATAAGVTFTIGVALAVASYPAIVPFSFVEGTVTLAGAALPVASFSLKGDNGLDDARIRDGSPYVREQLENGLRAYTGSLAADFLSLGPYTRFANGTEAPLVLAFSNGADSLTITTNARLDGDTPTVADMTVLNQPLPFACVSATSDAAAITAVLVNADASSA
jgi:Phage tail tube protein